MCTYMDQKVQLNYELGISLVSGSIINIIFFIYKITHIFVFSYDSIKYTIGNKYIHFYYYL